jgi:hypothetical protein
VTYYPAMDDAAGHPTKRRCINGTRLIAVAKQQHLEVAGPLLTTQ